MNCHDAREGFSRGGMGLTEQALVHAHVMQCVECQKERESLPQVVSSRRRVALARAGLTRLRVLRLISLTVSRQAAANVIESARVGLTRVVNLLTRVRGLLTRFAHLLTRACVSLSISFTVSVQAAERVIFARPVEAMRILDPLTRARRLLPLFFRRSGQAAARAIGATWGVGRTVVTTAGAARSLLAARMSPTFGARPLLKVCTGIVSLAVPVVAMLFWWPRQWTDNLMGRFSAGERLSRDVRRPVDRNPAELAAAAPLAKTSAPKPVSAPQPAPVEVSPPETARVAMRRKAPETQTEIPAPLRRPDPALAQSLATASAPMPTEATQNAEASDASAAIDWLVKGGSSRRRVESP